MPSAPNPWRLLRTRAILGGWTALVFLCAGHRMEGVMMVACPVAKLEDEVCPEFLFGPLGGKNVTSCTKPASSPQISVHSSRGTAAPHFPGSLAAHHIHGRTATTGIREVIAPFAELSVEGAWVPSSPLGQGMPAQQNSHPGPDLAEK